MSGLIGWSVVLCASTMIATPARAAFHLWNLQELYSNSSGTLQFIELFTTSNTQTNFSVVRSIAVSNVGATLTNTFNLPTGTLAPTFNRSLLFGTAGIQAAGGPAPDYIIPNGFLFTAGGTISTFGTDINSDGPYTALPTDGSLSRTWVGGGNAVNSPRNFAGQAGVVVVPEPTSVILVPVALGSMYWMSRRRKLKSSAIPTEII